MTKTLPNTTKDSDQLAPALPVRQRSAAQCAEPAAAHGAREPFDVGGSQLHLSEAERQIRRGLECLTDRQRFVVERAWGLSDGTVYSFRQIAKAMGLSSHKTVIEHYRAGLTRLAKEIQDPTSLLLELDALVSEPLVAPAVEAVDYFELEGGPYNVGPGTEVPAFFPKPGTRMPAPPKGVRLSPLEQLAFLAVERAKELADKGLQDYAPQQKRRNMNGATAAPTLVERVAELERFRAEAARQLGIPESDKAVSEAVDQFVASAQEED